MLEHKPLVGVVVPTLGSRPRYLRECLVSVSQQSTSVALMVVIVAPRNEWPAITEENGRYFDYLVEDPRKGLPAAINLGLASFPTAVKFATWLGDDDILEAGSLVKLVETMERSSSAVAAFGECLFIDGNGDYLGKSSLGRLATAIIRFGPNLITQPSSIFSLAAYREIGGLDTNLQLAFDLDMFIKLRKVGTIRFVPFLAARYRWHQSSLSSINKKKSRREARAVRRSHLPKVLRFVSFVWEAPMELAAVLVNSLDRKSHSKTQ